MAVHQRERRSRVVFGSTATASAADAAGDRIHKPEKRVLFLGGAHWSPVTVAGAASSVSAQPCGLEHILCRHVAAVAGRQDGPAGSRKGRFQMARENRTLDLLASQVISRSNEFEGVQLALRRDDADGLWLASSDPGARRRSR